MSGEQDNPPPPDRFVMYTHGWLRRYGPMLIPSERSVYDALGMYFSPERDGLVWPGFKTVQKDTGITRRQTIGAAIRGLEAKRLIDIIDWSIPIREKNGSIRDIGGGPEDGKNLVYLLLHVDDFGYHCEHRVRASISDLEKTQAESAEITSALTDFALSGATFNVMREWMLARYPFVKDDPTWSTASDRIGSAGQHFFDLDDFVFWSALIPIRAIESRYPRSGRPDMSLFFRRPDSEKIQMAAIEKGWERWNRAAAAVKPVYSTIIKEINATTGLPDIARQRGGTEAFSKAAPVLDRMSRELKTLPAYLGMMAKTAAIDAGDIIYCVSGTESPGRIECQDPDEWVPKETAALATLWKNALTPDHKKVVEATIQSVKRAQAEVLSAFVRAIFADSSPDPLVSRLAADRFNRWANAMNGMSLLVPIPIVTQEQIDAIRSELPDPITEGEGFAPAHAPPCGLAHPRRAPERAPPVRRSALQGFA